ncbi:MAG: hypothetical protein QY325_14570 [Flavobacteriales bacterium]|jgi:hypothetical protein|nr:MAG: hypothetical protein QY325_14570 [Flavobacteriales bacterium]
MRIPLLLAALLLLARTVSGQALLILPTAEEPDQLRFNERFIARNGIRSIVGERLVKRDREPMRPERERLLFRFDPAGRLVYSNNSFGQPGSGRDTASVTFERDSSGWVTRRLRNDLSGHFAHVLVHDAQGRVIRETYQRIENLGPDRYHLVPGTATEISDEQYRYVQLSDTALRKVFLNNLGLPYREQTYISDSRGYVLSIEDHYLVSQRRGRITFTYDDHGWLATRTEQPDLAQAGLTRHAWRYDAVGNVLESELWKQEQQVWREEYLYEEGTMLLKARLRKDLATGTIHVTKFIVNR